MKRKTEQGNAFQTGFSVERVAENLRGNMLTRMLAAALCVTLASSCAPMAGLAEAAEQSSASGQYTVNVRAASKDDALVAGSFTTVESSTNAKHASRNVGDKSKCTAKISTQAWTGKKLKPAPVVKWGNKTLKKDVHYKIVAYGTNKNNGSKGNWVKIKGIGSFSGERKIAFSIKKPSVIYRTSQQDFGAGNWTSDGKPSGNAGSSKRVETLWLNLKNRPTSGSILYRTRVGEKGWMPWTSNGKQAGTSGENLSIVTLQAKLTGEMAKKYDIWYRSYVKDNGWLGWAKNGASTGVARYDSQIESVQFKILPKGSAAPGTTNNPFNNKAGYYKLKCDSWNFENYATYIDRETYVDIFGESVGDAMYRADYDGYNSGVCYGFSTSVGAIKKQKNPDASSFGASNIYGISNNQYSAVAGMTAEEFIEHCHVAQFDYRLLDEMWSNADNYAGLVAAVKEHQYGGKAIEIDLLGWLGGHSVLPLGIKYSNSNETVLNIYDCNHPSEVQTLTLYKDKRGEYTGFNYSDDYYYTTVSWETPADDLEYLMAGNGIAEDTYSQGSLGNKHMSLVCSDVDLTVVSEGETYELSSDVKNNSDEVIPVVAKDGRRDKVNAYWVSFDTSDMVVKDIEQDATISVATDTGSVEVEAEEGSTLHMTVSDEQQNSVDIDCDKGDEFQVTYREDTGGKGLEEREVAGTATADVVETALTTDGEVSVVGA